MEILAPLRNDADLLCAACLFGVHDVLREPDEWFELALVLECAKLVTDLSQLMKLSGSLANRLLQHQEARGR